jgi:hypothetical protein
VNTSIYEDLMHVSRKNVSDSWAEEAFTDVGVLRGKLQFNGGAVGNLNGAVHPGAGFTFYCDPASSVQLSDIMFDVHGRSFTVVSVQWNGVSNFGDHMELGLSQR